MGAITIPCYPEFIPLSLDLKAEINSRLSLAPDGVSEFSFAGLYLFRNRYQYKVSRLEEKTLILSGIQPPHTTEGGNRTFFMTPCAAPGRGTLEALFAAHDYWKNIPDSVLAPNLDHFNDWGIEIEEDRDNFDYLYLRSDLAELRGKKFHKKRNLIAQFNSVCVGVEKPLSAEIIPDAMEVLDHWKQDKGEVGDHAAAQEALELFAALDMKGSVYYINGKPAAWCLGESLARNRIFAVHFEKALEEYKGIYQYINQAFATSLPEEITYINREQDLGDEGLRQAKMSYRPSGFVRKYIGKLKSSI